jgi:hypothetical protein
MTAKHERPDRHDCEIGTGRSHQSPWATAGAGIESNPTQSRCSAPDLVAAMRPDCALLAIAPDSVRA